MSGNFIDYTHFNSSLNQGEKVRLAEKTHKVREIFLKYISNDVHNMSVEVLNTYDLEKNIMIYSNNQTVFMYNLEMLEIKY
ncbi:hypothetical protein [Wolbachia endosymbiont of Encarsia formosa]|uniref:hypothetical protein n=1 Tax=Wolbachia endosymbiont of Encarsia formosa TaxID=77125 RepID=UPI0031BB0AFA